MNIRLELTITDQRGSEPGATKQVTMLVSDRDNGMIRSRSFVGGYEVPLRLEARPEILEANRIRLRMTLNYGYLEGNKAAGPDAKNDIAESLSVILENGKPLMIAQSADPLNDRRVAVEVKATILR